MTDLISTPYDVDISVIGDTRLSSNPPLLYLGGFQQNPEKMQGLQYELLEQAGLPSVGLSAFDVLQKEIIIERRTIHDADKGKQVHDVSWSEKRMRMRAAVLMQLAVVVLPDFGITADSAVLTHCAGANVLLAALRTTAGQGILGEVVTQRLPQRGVLAEPMIVEGRELSDLTRANLKHEGLATLHPDQYVSLSGLQAKSGEKANATDAIQPLLDILKTKSTERLVNSLKDGCDFKVLVGSHDVAAPEEGIRAGLRGTGYEGIVHNYPDQTHFGHGYLLAEPARAARAVIDLLDLAA